MLRPKKTRVIAVVLAIFMLASVGILAVSPIVHADEYQGNYASSSTVDGKILDHQLYYYLLSCFYRENQTSVDSHHIESWEWLDNRGGQSHSARGAMYTDVSPECVNGDSLSEAFGRFGFTDPFQTFCSLSYTYNTRFGGNGKAGEAGGGGGDTGKDTPGYNACMTGKGEDARWDGVDGSNAHTTQRDAVKRLILSTDRGRAATSFADYQQYVRSYRTFMNGCSIKLVSEYTTGAAVNDENKYKVSVVTLDDNGTPKSVDWLGVTTADPYDDPGWASNVPGMPDTGTTKVGTDKYPIPVVATESGNTQFKTCGELAQDTVRYAPAYVKYLADNPDEGAVTVTGDGSNNNIDVKCADEWSLGSLTNPLDWLSCNLLKGMVSATKAFDDTISRLLCINESSIFSGAKSTCSGFGSTTAGSADAFHKSWNVFRMLALGLLAIGGLIMILSQGLGFELFDAYTVKKTLPRIIVAAIGITLSWQIMSFLVSLSNGLGIGVRSLIYTPFNASGLGIDPQILGGGEMAITALFAGTAFVALGAIGLLSFIATAALAVIIALFTLVIRNMLVILLVLLAPIAIAAYILPNTEKYYKTWWDWLIKTLLVFPIIAAMIAIGHVFAAITSTNGNTIASFVAFAAYFAPYFLIPAAFRFAGGLMATLGGFANDRSRGAFDRLKKFRSEAGARNLHAVREGNRYRNNNALARGFNRATRTAATLPSAGLHPRYMRSRYTASEAQHVFEQAEELRTKNGDFMSGMQDSRILRAILEGGHEGRAGLRRVLADTNNEGGFQGAELDTALGIAERMQHAGSREAVATAAAIQQSTTGTGYADVGQMLDTIADASGGNRVLGGKMLGAMRGGATSSGRHDLGAAGFGTMAGQLSQVYDHGPGSADVGAIERDAFSSVDVTSLARGRGESVRNLSQAVAGFVNSAPAADLSPEQRAAAFAERARYQAQLENFTEASRDFGALARSHEAHTLGRDSVQPIPRATAQGNPDYSPHRSVRGFDPNDPHNPPSGPEE